MHPELAIRPLRRPRLELLAIQLKHQRLLLLALLLRQSNFKLEDSMFLWYRCDG